MRKFSLLFISLISIFAFSFSKVENDCRLVIEDYDLKTLSTGFNQQSVDSFFNDTISEISILHYVENIQKSSKKLAILYIKDKKGRLSSFNYLSVGNISKHISSKKVKRVLNSASQLGTLSCRQKCNESIHFDGNTNHFFIIKKEGKIVFKYYSLRSSYEILGETDKLKIKGMLDIIGFLNGH